ncbi:transposase [Zymobacter sp. IVIA_5232.4 C2]
MLERYGPWKTVYHRFGKWRDSATFDRVLERLSLCLFTSIRIDGS